MTNIIVNHVCRGVAGKRQGKIIGVVIHNDAGSINATAQAYSTALSVMNIEQLARGFAHYYIDKNDVVETESPDFIAWHTANADGNANYVGYEVCQSAGTSVSDFLANEQATFKQVAKDLKKWGLQADRATVRLHKEFSATACPHRSSELHGASVDNVKDYFIEQIKKYMNETEKPVSTEKRGKVIMYIYWKKEQGKTLSDAYFVNGNNRMYIQTDTLLKECRDLVKRYGGATDETTYNFDNFGLRTIEKTTDLVKF
jgi:hypothetical protein